MVARLFMIFLIPTRRLMIFKGGTEELATLNCLFYLKLGKTFFS